MCIGLYGASAGTDVEPVLTNHVGTGFIIFCAAGRHDVSAETAMDVRS